MPSDGQENCFKNEIPSRHYEAWGCFEGQSSKCGGAALPSPSELWPGLPPPPPGGRVPTGSSGNGSSARLGSLKPPQGFQGVCSLSVRTMFSRGDKGLTSRILPAGPANPIPLAMSPCALCAPGGGPGRARAAGPAPTPPKPPQPSPPPGSGSALGRGCAEKGSATLEAQVGGSHILHETAFGLYLS